MQSNNFELLGQLFLPPRRLCSIRFLRDILVGNKKYFHTHEMALVNITRLPDLTVKNVLEKVYDVPEVRIYLPDFDSEPEKRIARDFLFSIVHKLDGTFFRRVVSELEER